VVLADRAEAAVQRLPAEAGGEATLPGEAELGVGAVEAAGQPGCDGLGAQALGPGVAVPPAAG
jgi:hypothetical protein